MNRKISRKKILKYALIIPGILAAVFYAYIVYPLWGMPFNGQRHGNPPLTPAWALECWLWEDDVNTANRVDELLEGYAEHDIPVRTIILDSPWTLRYNDFEVDEDLYPDPKKWFGKLQDQGYRVVLWMTTMVDSYSKDTKIKESDDWFNNAKENGYLINDGKQISWWKGKGGFIDYTNPEAMKWWRGLQQPIFHYGIDGWKLDGTATLFRTSLGPVPMLYQKAHDGWMTTRQYMDMYYREEYAHGLKQNPEFVTLSRSVDRLLIHPEGFAPIDAAPVTWVGDQKHTWKSSGTSSTVQEDNTDLVMEGIRGIEMAMEHTMAAADLGYNIIGSDIAGFSGRDIPPRLYIRWAQFSTFCGLFLNGGHGERALWKRSREELEIIRKFSWLHTELIPYMYSYVMTGHQGGKILQTPVSGKYHYMFGDYLLVAPIYKDSYENEVVLPGGKWYYMFDDGKTITGPKKIKMEFPLDEYPVFIKAGAIIPMHIERSYTGYGSQATSDYFTVLIYPEGESAFTVHHPDGSGSTDIRVIETDEKISVQLSGQKKQHIFRIHMGKPPVKVLLDQQELNKTEDYIYDESAHKLIITTDIYRNGNYNILK